MEKVWVLNCLVMPIFEYRCQECGHQFELIVFRAEAPTRCPKCKTEKTERLVSGFAMGAASTKSAGGCRPGRFT